jgi:hypothetical protein
MTTDQKEQYVIQLYTEGKTFKVIAQMTHTSFRDISAIIKRHQENIERQSGQSEERNDDYDIKSKSKTTQAIKLFSEDKDLVDVVIALDLQPDEVREIYRQFLKLHNMHQLVRDYDKMGDYLPILWNLYRLMLDRELNKEDLIKVVSTIKSDQFQYLQGRIKSMTDASNWLEHEIKKKEYHLRSLYNKIKEFSYRKEGIIPMTNSVNEPTYRPDSMYPPFPDDTSTKPIPYMWD